MLVRVVLDRAFSVAVVDRQAMNAVIALSSVMACISVVMRVEMV